METASGQDMLNWQYERHEVQDLYDLAGMQW